MKTCQTVGKHDDVEGVGGPEHVDEIAHQLFRRVQWKAVHRSGHVEHEDVSRGGIWSGSTTCGGSAISRKKFILSLIEQQARGDLLASQPVAKNEVAIARQSFLVVERHLRAPRRRRGSRPDATETRAPGAARRSTPRRTGELARGASPCRVYGALTNSSCGDAWLSRFSEYPGSDDGR